MIILIIVALLYLAGLITAHSCPDIRDRSIFYRFIAFCGKLTAKAITIIVVINAVWVGLRTIGLLK